MRSCASCDVLVIGAGPAGATAAQLLSSWGRSVILVHRPDGGRHTLGESLPASTRKLLRFLGQLDRVEDRHFYPNTGNDVNWGGSARTTGSAEPGFHVSRAAFDAVLRSGAEAAGARIVEGAVRRIDDSDRLRATCSSADGASLEFEPRYVLDCSGRVGIFARRGLRRQTTGYRTMAIVAEWECPGWPGADRTLTTIESYADGWAWSVPLSDTRRQCTVMVDTDRVKTLTGTYSIELAKARALTGRLSGARQVSSPWSCDSTLYDSSRASDGRVLLVGDAASFIEPLSSAGVKKALLSAWRAAVVTNTCLDNPAMATAACDLHDRREQEVYADCVHRAGVFFAQAAAAYDTAFWTKRAEAHPPVATPGTDALATEGEMQDAFERLRGAVRVRLRPSGALQYTPLPVIDGRQVVMRDAILMPGLDTPLQFAAGVDLVRLTRIAATCDEVPAIIDAYQQRVGPVSAGGLLTGLSLLVARQALVAEESKP